jgi:hypothetical protein
VQPPVSFDRVAGEYDATRALPAELREFAVHTLVGRIAGGSLFEAGVGTGRLSGPLQEAGVNVTGCDVSAAMLATARGKGVRRLIRADLRLLPFRDGSFDCAMTNHVLHLVADWRQGFAEVARVARREYLSVLQRSTFVPNLSEEYHRIAEREGFPARHSGLRERDLPDRLPPDHVDRSPSLHREFTTDLAIDRLRSRTYSTQWQIPDAPHEVAVAELRTAYGGRTVREEVRLEVAAWNVTRVHDFLRALTDSA